MLSIILLTYARTDYAIRTIQGIRRHLMYDGDIEWIVADDGSHRSHFDAVVNEIGYCKSITERQGYGANANWAWTSSKSDVTLWLEDDWELKRDLDITPYVKFLREADYAGMIRLGHMPINLDLHSCGYDGRMYLEVKKSHPYAFSGNPHLKHKRFGQYGKYPEGKNPGDTEIAYDGQIRRHANGVSIYWPLLIGDNPFFAHIGENKSY